MNEPPLTDRIRERLARRHKGRRYGVTCRDLAQAVDASERAVRDAVTELRLAGVPVCGYPGRGYFLARTTAELKETCDFLEGRGLHSLKLAARLRKVPMQSLLGQLSLTLFEEPR